MNIGEINIQGGNAVCKRVLVEKLAEKHDFHIVCVVETKHPHASTEVEAKSFIGDEQTGGEYKWYVSTDVGPPNTDEIAQSRNEGKPTTTEMRNAATGVAVMVNKKWSDEIVDVRLANGSITVA